MKKILIANWKENPATEKKALALFSGVATVKPGKGTDVVICPPFLYLERIAEERRRMKAKFLALGGQDVFWEDMGAHTSEIGPWMLKHLGLSYAIVGHSERRREMGETDAMINKKIKAALTAGLKVILCVGEPIDVRKKGVRAAESYIASQLKKDLKGISTAKGISIAYEPIWAIGSGKSDSPDDARAMAIYIKKEASRIFSGTAPVLYGGSVNSKNVADFVSLKEIAGALVGGASLKAEEFKKMIAVVGRISQ